jgi:2-phospho-L-lactate guanylyltransferase (CobY/MobA/RfbA family)
VSPAAIATAVAAIAKPRTLAIAAASKDGGTNLLACRPASAVPLHFGAHSCREHMRAARQSGLSVAVLRMPELMLDIDRSEDLDLFQALHTKTRTHALLSKLRSAVPGTGALATEGAH